MTRIYLSKPRRASSLGPVEDGILVAEATARMSITQLERLHELGRLPCRENYEAAVQLARSLGIPDPTPDQITCDQRDA